jgi:hypothetical protein
MRLSPKLGASSQPNGLKAHLYLFRCPPAAVMLELAGVRGVGGTEGKEQS